VEQSKCLLLLPPQDICALAVGGLLCQAEWRAAPTVMQTDSPCLMARFAAFCSNYGEEIHVKKAIFCQLTIFTPSVFSEEQHGMRK